MGGGCIDANDRFVAHDTVTPAYTITTHTKGGWQDPLAIFVAGARVGFVLAIVFPALSRSS